MGIVESQEHNQQETRSLLSSTTPPPKDSFNLAYISHFTLGLGFLLPWNAFINAVDYFAYLYPNTSIDRTFAISYMLSCLFPLLLIVGSGAHRSRVPLFINSGIVIFILTLLLVPLLDVVYVKGRTGVYVAYDVTVAATAAAGIADALVQGGVIGAAGELPERYMQAVVAGTAASGVLVSALRIVTKAIYPQDDRG